MLRVVYARRPAPLSLLAAVRRIGDREDALGSRTEKVKRTGEALANPFLAKRLGDRQFGHWTASAQALNVLEGEIARRPPTRILELGGGLSTACFARYMVEHGDGGAEPALVSIDESDKFGEETGRLLAELKLDGQVSLHHAPLQKQRVAGREVNSYVLPSEVVAELERVPPDLVFVDGPSTAGGKYARFAALVLVLPYLAHGCRFYLDDALRDSALEYAVLWSELEGVDVLGVAFAGHGLLFGLYSGVERNVIE
jgi:predicted O-methyltransferase YrrM